MIYFIEVTTINRQTTEKEIGKKMKKKMIIAVMSLLSAICFADTVTNSVDVYDMKVSVRTPVVKLAKATKSSPAYVYRDVETRTLKGKLTLTWVKEEGDDFETVIPALSLYDTKDKANVIDYSIVDTEVNEFGALPFDFSIIGKKMNKSSATFVGVNENVDGENAGYKFLEFVGFGSTLTYKTKVAACIPCGFTLSTGGKCTRISSLSGKVTGMYSCGCGDDSPSKSAQSCGYIDDATGSTPILGCDGTWTAKYNKKLSH